VILFCLPFVTVLGFMSSTYFFFITTLLGIQTYQVNKKIIFFEDFEKKWEWGILFKFY